MEHSTGLRVVPFLSSAFLSALSSGLHKADMRMRIMGALSGIIPRLQRASRLRTLVMCPYPISLLRAHYSSIRTRFKPLSVEILWGPLL